MPSSNLESWLKEDGELIYTSEGHSMHPLIQSGQDVLHIIKLDCPPKRGDVLLYKDSKGHYVLHRVIRIKKDGTLILSGDNNSWKDEPINKESVLGKLDRIYKKDGSEIDLDKDKMLTRFYCVHLYPLKTLLLKGRRLIRKAFKK